MNWHKAFNKGCLLIIALFYMMMSWNVQTYADTLRKDKGEIDFDNLSEGWIIIKYNGEVDAKVILCYEGNKVYTYSISQETENIIPFAYGSGEYSLSIYERIHDNKREYTLITSKIFDVSLKDELAPFLCPNIIIDYDDDMELIKYANRLKDQYPDTSDYIESVYKFVSKYNYDYEKAENINIIDKDYIPDVEYIYNEQKGICYDYAAVMVAMLRSQGVPSKIEFGFVNGGYHAWVNVYQYDESLQSYVWRLYDPTFASSADSSVISEYMHDPENYKPIYVN